MSGYILPLELWHCIVVMLNFRPRRKLVLVCKAFYAMFEKPNFRYVPCLKYVQRFEWASCLYAMHNTLDDLSSSKNCAISTSRGDFYYCSYCDDRCSQPFIVKSDTRSFRTCMLHITLFSYQTLEGLGVTFEQCFCCLKEGKACDCYEDSSYSLDSSESSDVDMSF